MFLRRHDDWADVAAARDQLSAGVIEPRLWPFFARCRRSGWKTDGRGSRLWRLTGTVHDESEVRRDIVSLRKLQPRLRDYVEREMIRVG
jgi:hypothetical protein